MKVKCIDCGKLRNISQVRNSTSKRCYSCGTKLRYKNMTVKEHKQLCIRMKKISKLKFHKHHIYLKKNSNETMILPKVIHNKLHRGAYEYLVKIGKIKQYIKYFLKKVGFNEEK